MALFAKKDDPQKLWEQFFKVVLKYDWDRAYEILVKLKSLEPQNAQVHIKLAEILQRKGDNHKAIAEYHTAARFLVEMINMQKALAIYKLILRLKPDDREAVDKSRQIMHEMGMIPVNDQEQVTTSVDENTGHSGSLEDALSSHPVFSALNEKEVEWLTHKANHMSFSTGEEVIKENDSGDSVFIIKSGFARVLTTMLGQIYELAVLGSGDFFGEIGFLSGMPRTATVKADGTLEVMEISRELVSGLADSNPQILEQLAETSRIRTLNTLDRIQGTGQ